MKLSDFKQLDIIYLYFILEGQLTREKLLIIDAEVKIEERNEYHLDDIEYIIASGGRPNDAHFKISMDDEGKLYVVYEGTNLECIVSKQKLNSISVN